LSSSWPVFFPEKEEGEPNEDSQSSLSVLEMCRELFGTSFAAPSTVPLIHQQFSNSQDQDDASQAFTARTVDDRRYPQSVCLSAISERRLPMGSTISVVSDPTNMASDDASRLECSPSRGRRSHLRRPLALAVGFDALEDSDGRTVVITPGPKHRSPLRVPDSPPNGSPHRSVSVPKSSMLPPPVPESLPYLPELRRKDHD